MAWCGVVASCPSFCYYHQTRESLCIHGFVWGLSGGSERTDSYRTHTFWATVTPAVTHTSFTRLQTRQQTAEEQRENRNEKRKKTYSSVFFREEIGTIVQPFLLWRDTQISERTIGIQRRQMLVITRCIGGL